MVDLTSADWSQFAAVMLSPGVPLDQIGENTSVSLGKIVVPIRKAIHAMEKTYDALLEPGRGAWGVWWRTLEAAGRTLHMKAADVYAAMAELEERDAYTNEWAAQLVAALHSPALADETVTLQR